MWKGDPKSGQLFSHSRRFKVSGQVGRAELDDSDLEGRGTSSLANIKQIIVRLFRCNAFN